MEHDESERLRELIGLLHGLRRRIRALSVAVVLMALAMLLTAAAVFGQQVDYFGRDPLLFGGAGFGAALLGFGFGWFAGRRA